MIRNPASSLDESILQAWIGRTSIDEEQVGERVTRQFLATLGPWLAVTATDVPLGLHWCLMAPDALTTELGDDGHPPKGGLLPRVALPRRMWAGGEIELVAPLRQAATIARVSRVDDVKVKSGSTGPLCFVNVAHTWLDTGTPIMRERQDIVYRGPPTPGARAVPQSPTDQPWDHSETLIASSALLFRYSALTFNAHRIHYDLPYARDVEGYGGLVVQGPLQATLLLNLAAKMLSQSPRRFAYRGKAPMLAEREMHLRARLNRPDQVICWTQSEQGEIGMSAEAVA